MRKAGLNLAMLPVGTANCEKKERKREKYFGTQRNLLFSFDIIYTLYV